MRCLGWNKSPIVDLLTFQFVASSFPPKTVKFCFLFFCVKAEIKIGGSKLKQHAFSFLVIILSERDSLQTSDFQTLLTATHNKKYILCYDLSEVKVA